MRPEAVITLNKPSFRADEPITGKSLLAIFIFIAGFVDIDTHTTAPVEGEKLWITKIRLIGYAQMDTHWKNQARNSSWQDKARYETLAVSHNSKGWLTAA